MTVLFGSSFKNLQFSLDRFYDYCKEWKLTINCDKTKVLIFAGSKRDRNKSLMLGGKALVFVDEYKYLGVIFDKKISYKACISNLCRQATKAMYFILRKGRLLNLSIKCQLYLFDAMVKHILLYGCEIWGFVNIRQLESVHRNFMRKLFLVK